MRVVQIGMGWFPERPGGLDRVYYNLLRHLPDVGVDVRGCVVATRQIHEFSRRVSSLAAPTAPLPRRLWGARRTIAQVLRERPPDLLSSHFALFTWPALDLIRGYPLVVHFHGPWSGEIAVEGADRLKRRACYAIERAVYKRALQLITLSRAFKAVLSRSYDIPEERIRVIPGGVDAPRFAVSASKERARAEFGLPNDRPIIVTVRRLARRMGLEELLQAVAVAKRSTPEILLIIAGSGPLARHLETRVSELGLDANVRLFGFVPDERLPLLYRAATISVVPSVALEGFGLTTIESLAAGTPVLVTPVGGLPEVVKPLSPELVMADAATNTLAEGLRDAMIGSLSLPSPEQCQNYVRTNFDWPVIAAQVRNVYLEALA